MQDQEETLKELRMRIKNNPNVNKYNPADLHRTEIEDWWLESFLRSRDYDIHVSSAVFFECLKWRQTFGVNAISLFELRDLMEQSFIYFYGNDIDDNRLLWINFNKYSSNNQLNEKLFVFWLERHVIDTENQPIAIFFNFHETLANSMDIQFIKFVMRAMIYYYPDCMRQIYVFELPARLSAPWRLTCSYLDAHSYSAILALNSRNISSYIPIKYIPKSVGGENDYVFQLKELARCTGSPLAKLRRFSHPFTNDRKPSGTDITQSRKTVKFYLSSEISLEDVSVFNRSIDWQHRNFMAIAPKRSLILDYKSTNEPSVKIILQSMSSWFVYFNVGINSRRQIEMMPTKGFLEPNGREIITVRSKNPIKSPRKYKIEIVCTRVREMPDDLDTINVYDEPVEDRVKFFYDCFVNSNQTNGTVTSTREIKRSASDKKIPLSKETRKWYEHQMWPFIIAFDVILLAIVIYIYS